MDKSHANQWLFLLLPN